MTINDLIEKLQELLEEGQVTGEEDVIVASDPEGNSFRTLDEVHLGRYDGDSAWPHQTEPDGQYDEEDLRPEAELVLVIWP